MVAMPSTLAPIWYRDRVSSYGRVVIWGALVACRATPSPRERALGLLPSEATIVAAADGPALAAWRRVVDIARPYAPAGFGCVIDAALAFVRGVLVGERVVSSPNLPYGVA